MCPAVWYDCTPVPQVTGGNWTHSKSTTVATHWSVLNSGTTITIGSNDVLGAGSLSMAAGATMSWVAGSNFTVGKHPD